MLHLRRECFEDCYGRGRVTWTVLDDSGELENFGSEQAAKAAYPADTKWIRSKSCMCPVAGKNEECCVYPA